ncbi:MAG: GcrA cell cycle regulator [Mesorhizobium sp.]|nr:MAG: GcrA cell cycle regulator [Mesorhizobium sp.]
MASYTDAELQEIARLLEDGLSASRVAAAFSALRGSTVSRDAIIGIVHRNALLGEIGFANGKGLPAVAKRVADRRTVSKRADGVPAHGKANDKPVAGTIGAAFAGAGARKAAAKRDPSPAWRPPRLFVREVLIADGEAYRFDVPVPPRGPVGRQPHGVAMRFIDCLFNRCRAPLNLTLEEDPDISIAEEAPGSQSGADMLCCGMRTKARKSYCTYHQARFRRRVFEATA